MTFEQQERAVAHFLKRGDDSERCNEGKMLTSKNKPFFAKFRVCCYFNEANHSTGMDQMLVVTAEVAKLYRSILRHTLRQQSHSHGKIKHDFVV